MINRTQKCDGIAIGRPETMKLLKYPLAEHNETVTAMAGVGEMLL